MANFATFGWFGPNCANISEIGLAGVPKYGEVYNTNTGSNPNFPLNVATNLFWGSLNINIQSTVVTFRNSPANQFVSNWNKNIQWSSYIFNSNVLRGPVTKARDLLCILENDGIHTSNTEFADVSSGVDSASANRNFSIPNGIFEENKNNNSKSLIFALFVRHIILAGSSGTPLNDNPSGGFIVSPVENPEVNNVIQNGAIITTPWGIAKMPIQIIGTQVSQATCNITVTEEDPEIRYA